MNRYEITSFVDSGSPVSLIRKSRATNIGDVESCSKTLSGFAGGKYVCSSKINTSVKIDGCVLNADLFLVDDNLLPADVLLGRDILCREGNRFVIEGDDCWL